jgi:Tat protein translocase TatB subunit
MLDFSLAEIALVAVVTVVFIGPKELPTVVRTVGKAIRATKSLTNEIKQSFDELTREAGITDAADHLNREIRMIKGDDGKMYEAYDSPIMQPLPKATPPADETHG